MYFDFDNVIFRKQMALSQTSRAASNEPTTMKLSHVKGVFIIYTIGIAIASTTLIWELIHFKKNKKTINSFLH